ncbi:MAG: YjbQ family protein [Armatimonadetes bacterium]|nr:YjbQ family protein [Armatimonadota bacterium]
MKTYTEYLAFQTEQKEEIIPITKQVGNALGKSGIQDGMILVSAMHITAAVYVNDLEAGLIEDIREWLQGLAPEKNYRHQATGETNGSAHLKNLIMHHQVIIPVSHGRLDLGPWQQIFYAEFDGQRKKRVVIKAIGI